MNRIFTLILMTLMFIGINNAQSVYDTVSMSGGYTNDVFYSLENGEVENIGNSNWTIAFSTGAQTSAIRINGGKGVRLWETTVDTANYNSLDTANLGMWQEVYDYDDVWDFTAFEFNRTGHPDYGWGTYNNQNHVIYGDRIFVIQTLDGTYYKVLIVKKELGEVTFRYSSIDNAFDTIVAYQASDLIEKNFVYYNMDDHTFNDREPVSSDWDMLFTRYYPSEYWGSGQAATGVLTNIGVEVAEVRDIPVADATQTDGTFEENKSAIGYDWKALNFVTFEFDLVDSLTYFVKTNADEIYKLNFTRFDGQSTGVSGFEKEFIADVTFINENEDVAIYSVYPNPSNAEAFIVLDAAKGGAAEMKVVAIDGSLVMQRTVQMNQGLNSFKLDVANFQPGMYFIQITDGASSTTNTLMVK